MLVTSLFGSNLANFDESKHKIVKHPSPLDRPGQSLRQKNTTLLSLMYMKKADSKQLSFDELQQHVHSLAGFDGSQDYMYVA